MRSPGTLVVARVLLVAAGVTLIAGGLTHPWVPVSVDGRIHVLTDDPTWAPSHWALTLAQAAAVPGVLLARALLHRQDAYRDAGLAHAGLLVLAVAFVVGTLGTLTAATGLRAAAGTGSVDAFTTVDAFTLGLGWLCLLLAAVGAALAGLALALAGATPRATIVGGVLAVTGALFALAAALVPPAHPWTHQFTLPYGAVAAGGGLVALAFVVTNA